MVSDIHIVGVSTLKEVLHYLQKGTIPGKIKKDVYNIEETEMPDFADIHGQSAVRRAAEIAAGGRHHFLMMGPPGAGKSLLAKCMPGILPSLTMEESLEVSSIYSVAGLLSSQQPLIRNRPFRAPHHTISPSAWQAEAGFRGRERSVLHIKVSCFWMNWQSLKEKRSKSCGSLWRSEESIFQECMGAMCFRQTV